MKQLFRALALTLTLCVAAPVPVVAAAHAAAAPAAQVSDSDAKIFGYVIAAIVGIGAVWWKFWGKKAAKASQPKACSLCTLEFEAEDLIALHPHTKEYVMHASPKVNMGHRPEYARADQALHKKRLERIPKQSHKVCPSCALTCFKSAYRYMSEMKDFANVGVNNTGTCVFHMGAAMGHGACEKCESRGMCLYCPVDFNNVDPAVNKCKLALDINWVRKNNPHMKKSLEKLCNNGTYDDSSDRLIELWDTLCADYPKMMAELRAIRPGDYTAHQGIGDRWFAKWNQI